MLIADWRQRHVLLVVDALALLLGGRISSRISRHSKYSIIIVGTVLQAIIAIAKHIIHVHFVLNLIATSPILLFIAAVVDDGAIHVTSPMDFQIWWWNVSIRT